MALYLPRNYNILLLLGRYVGVGRKILFYELGPAKFQNLIYYNQRSIDQSQSSSDFYKKAKTIVRMSALTKV